MTARGLGYKPDTPDSRDHRYGANSGPDLGPYVLDEPDQERFVRCVRNQGDTSSCVGNAASGGMEICAAIAGHPCALSASWPYAIGIEAEDTDYRGPLSDDGSYPRLVMQALRARGVLAESDRPFSEADVVVRPSPAQCLEAFDARGLQFFRIDAVGAARIAAIKDALRRGYAVIFGSNVDAAYQRNRGEIVRSFGPSIGGHMQVVVAIRDGIVRALNSWGESWGDLGLGNIDETLFAEMPISDLYVITWCPEVPHAA